MASLIRLVSASAPTEYDGKYVVKYDPSWVHPDGGYDGGWLEVTADPAKARRFETARDALSYWRQSHGLRADGRPNRPLTAWSIEIMPEDEEPTVIAGHAPGEIVRSLSELVAVHDLLCLALMHPNDPLGEIDPTMRPFVTGLLTSLCWALGHGELLEAAMTMVTMTLKDPVEAKARWKAIAEEIDGAEGRHGAN